VVPPVAVAETVTGELTVPVAGIVAVMARVSGLMAIGADFVWVLAGLAESVPVTLIV
jgi:hypothetical protein